jgi:hypothetical protein
MVLPNLSIKITGTDPPTTVGKGSKVNLSFGEVWGDVFGGLTPSDAPKQTGNKSWFTVWPGGTNSW